MAPAPMTRLNVSVRIAANAITASLVVAGSAYAQSQIEAQLSVDSTTARALSLELGFGLDHGSTQTTARIIADPTALDTLRKRGYAIQTLSQIPSDLVGYQRPDEALPWLQLLTEQTLRSGSIVIGRSVQRRPITAVWFGQPPESGAPAFRILSGHHGDEWSATEIALALVEELANADGTDPLVTTILDQATVWVVPFVNPDGSESISRYNTRNVDLNRNYDYEWNPREWRPGNGPFSEPETRAIRSFSQWVQPVQSISLHSGATNIGYVWNHTLEPAPDTPWLLAQSEAYAEAVADPDFWVTNGAAWYETWGDTNDWSYGRFGVMDYTVECTQEKIPAPDEIPTFVQQHLGAILDFISRMPDISGTVVAKSTGAPLSATVTLMDEQGPAGATFHTEPATGAFHRIVPNSDVSHVQLQAPGYATRLVPIESVGVVEMLPVDLRSNPVLPAPASSSILLSLDQPFSGELRLVQPGYPDLTTYAVLGRLGLPPTAIPGGAWTVIRDDGAVHPNSLMVDDATSFSLEGYVLNEDAWTLFGLGITDDVRVWALYGTERARRSIPVAEATTTGITISPSNLPSSGRVDLWVVNEGEHAFLTDIHQVDPLIWKQWPGTEVAKSGCACDETRNHPAALQSILLMMLVLRRRART